MILLFFIGCKVSIWLNLKAQESCMPWRQWRKPWCWIVTRYVMENGSKKWNLYYISLIDKVQFYTGSPSTHWKGNHFPSGSSFPCHSLRILSGIDVFFFSFCLYQFSSCVSLLKRFVSFFRRLRMFVWLQTSAPVESCLHCLIDNPWSFCRRIQQGTPIHMFITCNTRYTCQKQISVRYND